MTDEGGEYQSVMALLSALNVERPRDVVAFSLSWTLGGSPHLTVTKDVTKGLADKTTLLAAGALRPTTQERASWEGGS